MHLGTAMDELMRHQPTLKTDAMKAIIKVIEFLQYSLNHRSALHAFFALVTVSYDHSMFI